jgi:hypothetical protein
LRCRRDLATHRKVRQKGTSTLRGQVTRMALAKIPDKSFNPIRIKILGAQTVVSEANLAAHLIQQFRRSLTCQT